MTKARIQLDANQITQSIMQKLSQPLPEAGPNPQLLVSVYQEIFNRNSAFNSSAAQTTLLPVRPFPDVAFKSQAYKSMSFTESTEDNTTPSDRLDQETLYKSIISRTHIFNSSTAQTTLLPARPFPDLASKSQAHKSMSFMELIEENTPLYDRLNQEALYKSIISRRGNFFKFKKENGQNIFQLSLDKVKKINGTITEHILDLPESTFFENSQLNLTADNIKKILDFAINEFSNHGNAFENSKTKTEGTWEKACVELLSFIISLRLVVLFKKNPIQFEKISKNAMLKCFNEIKKHKTSHDSFDQLSLSTNAIRTSIISDYFTIDIRRKGYRLNIWKKQSISHRKTISPHEMISLANPQALSSQLRRTLRKCIWGILIENNPLGLLNHHILKDINRNSLISHFRPTLLHDCIHLLKAEYQFTFPKSEDGKPYGAVFDPCCGYGTTLIGALAHPEVKYFFANEPNPELPDRYNQMANLLNPTMKLDITNMKIEDMSKEQLGQNGRMVSLIIFSPPYGHEIYYEGMTNYAIETERNKLYHALLSTSCILSEGAYMLVFLGVLGSFVNLANAFSQLIQEPAHHDLEHIKTIPLTSMLRTTGPTSNREFLVIARKKYSAEKNGHILSQNGMFAGGTKRDETSTHSNGFSM